MYANVFFFLFQRTTVPPPVGSLAMSRIAAASGELLLLKRVLSKAAPTAVAKKTRRIKWSARRQSVDLSTKTACCMPRTCFGPNYDLTADGPRVQIGVVRCVPDAGTRPRLGGTLVWRRVAQGSGKALRRSGYVPRPSIRGLRRWGRAGRVHTTNIYVAQKTDRSHCPRRRVSCSQYTVPSRLVVQKSWQPTVFSAGR